MVFPVVMYRYESWTIKKAESQELMLLNCGAGELLRVPWTARRSNKSILKEINPGYSLEGLVLKLKLQYFGHLRAREEWDEIVGWHHQLNGNVFEQTQGDSEGQGSLACHSSWDHKNLTQFSN